MPMTDVFSRLPLGAVAETSGTVSAALEVLNVMDVADTLLADAMFGKTFSIT